LVFAQIDFNCRSACLPELPTVRAAFLWSQEMLNYRSAMVYLEKPRWASRYLHNELYGEHSEVVHYDPKRKQGSSSARLQQAWFNLPFFDYCIFFVDLSSLVWARLSLAQLRDLAKTPIFIKAHGLSAPAIDDLMRLGATDFFLHPVDNAEVVTRIKRHLRNLVTQPQCDELQKKVKSPSSYYLPALPKSRGNALSLHESARNYQVLLGNGATLEGFSMAVATRFANSGLGYQAIKRQVLSSFERAFVHTLLSRTNGNISAAARLAGQHRRTFWGLMRKHRIDADTYRDDSAPKFYI